MLHDGQRSGIPVYNWKEPATGAISKAGDQHPAKHRVFDHLYDGRGSGTSPSLFERARRQASAAKRRAAAVAKELLRQRAR